MDISQTNLSLLFVEQHNKTFVIPRYQRQYVWTGDKIEDFFDSMCSNETTFLGSIILKDNKNNKYDIIDGQQRYITLSILAAAVIDILKDDKNESIFGLKQAYRKILFKLDLLGNNDKQKLTVGDTISVCFGNILRGFSIDRNSLRNDEKTLINAYDILKSRLKEATRESSQQDRYTYFVKILENMQYKMLSLITVEDDDTAYEIFESVNSKGEELDSSDLLKNNIIRHTLDKEISLKTWNEIYSRVENSKLSTMIDFISYHMTSKSKYVPKKHLYRSIKGKIGQDENGWDDFLSDMALDSVSLEILSSNNIEDFSDILSSYNDREKLFNALQLLRKLPNKTWIILFLTLIRYHKRNDGQLCGVNSKFYEFFSNYCTIYFYILSRSGNRFFSLINDVSMKLDASSSHVQTNKIITSFKLKLIELAQVTANDISNGIMAKKYGSNDNNTIIRYLLSIYEKSLYQDSIDAIVNYRDLTIEHIIPKNPTNFGFTKRQVEPFVNTIGNLTLLTRIQNQHAGNREDERKFERYVNSPLKINSTLSLDVFRSSNLDLIAEEVEMRGKRVSDAIAEFFKDLR